MLTLLVVTPAATILIPLSLSQLLPWRLVGPIVFAFAAALYLRAGGRYDALDCPRCGGRFFESKMRSETLETYMVFELLNRPGIAGGSTP
jgi:hypothetical protein